MKGQREREESQRVYGQHSVPPSPSSELMQPHKHFPPLASDLKSVPKHLNLAVPACVAHSTPLGRSMGEANGQTYKHL